MPEGDTLWRTAASMQKLVGLTVEAARPRTVARLVGTSMQSVEPFGKHLLMRFSSGLILHTHLGMRGSWHLYRPGQAWLKPDRLARCVLDCGSWQAVLFSAAVLELVADAETAVAHLGSDILASDFEVQRVVERARAFGARSIGELLLDQRVCAGIGNVYKCETLWALRLDPWLRPADLDDDQIRHLYLTARRFMRGNLQGWAGRRFEHAPGGRRPAAVHGRAGRPCPRCGTPVRVRAQGEQARFTYFCPRCQKAAQDGPPAEARVPSPAERLSPPGSGGAKDGFQITFSAPNR